VAQALLAPAVQLSGVDTVGSGTIVHSERETDSDEVVSHVLTAWHVVRDIRAERGASGGAVRVTVYGTLSGDRSADRTETVAELLAHDAELDLALLRLRSDELLPVARTATDRRATRAEVWDEVCAVGCPLGIDPVSTRGEILDKNRYVRRAGERIQHWLISAPTYYGNSGGGVFLLGSRQLVGVFSKIYTYGRADAVAVPHLGLMVPIDTIREWLGGEGLGHVLD
jgi:S1-C subfamily serine protease